MKIYAPPSNIPIPSFLKDGELNPHYDKECESFKDRLRGFCKANSKHKYAGEIAFFGVGDGFAEYMILNGRSVIHLPLGDGYQYPYAHRLRISDFINVIEHERKLSELFQRNQKTSATN